MITFINIVVDLQALHFRGFRHKLPETARSSGRNGIEQVAFDDRKIFEIVGNIILLKDGLYNRKGAVGSLDDQQRCGIEVGIDQKLTVETFLYIRYLERHGFPCKIGAGGKIHVGVFVYRSHLIFIRNTVNQ